MAAEWEESKPGLAPEGRGPEARGLSHQWSEALGAGWQPPLRAEASSAVVSGGVSGQPLREGPASIVGQNRDLF